MSETPEKKVDEKPKEEEEDMPPPKPNGLNDYGKPLTVTIPPPFADIARRLLNRNSFSRGFVRGNRKHCSPHRKEGKRQGHYSKGKFSNRKHGNCGVEKETDEALEELKDLQNVSKKIEKSKGKGSKNDEVLIEDVVEARNEEEEEEEEVETENSEGLMKMLNLFKNTTKGVELKDGKLVVDFKELKQNFKNKVETVGDKLKETFEKPKKEKKFDEGKEEMEKLPPWLRVGEFVEKMEKMKNDKSVTEEDWQKFFTEEVQKSFNPLNFGGNKFGPGKFGKKHHGHKGFGQRGPNMFGQRGFGFNNGGRNSRGKGKQFGQFVQGLADVFNVDLKLNYDSDTENEDSKKNTNESGDKDQVIEIDIDLDTGKAKVLNKEDKTKEKENDAVVESEENVVENESGLSQADILKIITDVVNSKKKTDKKE